MESWSNSLVPLPKEQGAALLHAMVKWSEVIQGDTYPFSLYRMINFDNASITKDKTEKHTRLFTDQDASWTLADFQICSCLTYVLNKDLKGGNKINKWKTRSWKGVYAGYFFCHFSSIPLISIPKTTHTSPPVHVLCNEFNRRYSHSAQLMPWEAISLISLLAILW